MAQMGPRSLKHESPSKQGNATANTGSTTTANASSTPTPQLRQGESERSEETKKVETVHFAGSSTTGSTAAGGTLGKEGELRGVDRGTASAGGTISANNNNNTSSPGNKNGANPNVGWSDLRKINDEGTGYEDGDPDTENSPLKGTDIKDDGTDQKKDSETSLHKNQTNALGVSPNMGGGRNEILSSSPIRIENNDDEGAEEEEISLPSPEKNYANDNNPSAMLNLMRDSEPSRRLTTGGGELSPHKDGAVADENYLRGLEEDRDFFYVRPSETKTKSPLYIKSDLYLFENASSSSEWQRVVSKCTQFLTPQEVYGRVLSLPHRDWIKEQLVLVREKEKETHGIMADRREVLLQEHFRWLVWAVGCYYSDNANQPKSRYSADDHPIMGIRGKSMQQAGRQTFGSFKSVSEKRLEQMDHDDRLRMSRAEDVTIRTSEVPLPSVTSSAWHNGFIYKGVFFKLLPRAEGYRVRRELKALKSLYVELENSRQNVLKEILGEKSGVNLLFPLLAVSEFGGQTLYGSPVIYDSFEMSAQGDMLDIIPSQEKLNKFYLLRHLKVQNLICMRSEMGGFNPGDYSMEGGVSVNNTLSNTFFNNSSVLYDVQSLISNNFYLKNVCDMLPKIPKNSILFSISHDKAVPIAFQEYPDDQQVFYEEINKMLGYEMFMNTGNTFKDLNNALREINISIRDSHKEDPFMSPRNGAGGGGDNTHWNNNNGPGNGTLFGSKNNTQTINEIRAQEEAENSDAPRFVLDKLKTHIFGWELDVLHVNTKNESQAVIDTLKLTPNDRANFLAGLCYQVNPSKEDIEVHRSKSGAGHSRSNLNDRTDNDKLDSTRQDVSVTRLGKSRTDDPGSVSMVNQSGAGGRRATVSIDQLQASMYPLHEEINEVEDEEIPFDHKIVGNVLICAHMTNDYSFENSAMYDPKNLPTINGKGEDQATGKTGYNEHVFCTNMNNLVKTLDTTDTILNHASFKEAMKRHGFKMRYSWLVLTKVRSKRAKSLVAGDILIRCIKKLVYHRCAGKMMTDKTSLENAEDDEITGRLSLGYNNEYFKEVLRSFLIMIFRIEKYKGKEDYHQLMLVLFLSRLRLLCGDRLPGTQIRDNHLMNKTEIINIILEAVIHDPNTFLSGVEYHFGVTFSYDFLKKVRADKFTLLLGGGANLILTKDISTVDLRSSGLITLRERSFLLFAKNYYNHKSKTRSSMILSKKMAASKKRHGRGDNSDTRSTSMLSPVPSVGTGGGTPSNNRISVGGAYDVDMNDVAVEMTSSIKDNKHLNESSELKTPSRSKWSKNGSLNSSRIHSRSNLHSSTGSGKRTMMHFDADLIIVNDKNKVRELRSSNSMSSQAGNAEVPMSKKLNLELIIPSSLYSYFRYDRLSSVYSLPPEEVVSEWILSLESLLNDIHTPEGDQSALIEAYLIRITQYYINDEGSYDHADYWVRDMHKIKELLFTLFACSPEIIIAVQTWTGIIFGMTSQIDSEKGYILALKGIHQLYGDPRGRGTYAMPWELLLTWKLAILSHADNRTHDSELAEELFDSIIYGLKTNKVAQDEKDVGLSRLHDRSVDKLNDSFTKYLDRSSSNSFSVQKSLQDAIEDFQFNGGNIYVYPQYFLKYNLKRIPTNQILDILDQTFLQPELFYMWLGQHNPLSNQSGRIWNHFQIREFMFNDPSSHQPHHSLFSSSSSSTHLMTTTSAASTPKSTTTGLKERKPSVITTNGLTQALLAEKVYTLNKSDLRGSVYVWGTNSRGQLGLQTIKLAHDDLLTSPKVVYPRMLVALKNYVIKHVVCGYDFSLAVSIEGNLFAWGSNDCKQLGLGSDAPVEVQNPTLVRAVGGVMEVSCGNEHVVARDRAGWVYSWGNGEGGLLGHGNFDSACEPKKMEFFNPAKFKVEQICCGGLHTLAVTTDGRCYAWGRADGGQLGLPNRYLQIFQSEVRELVLWFPRRVEGDLVSERVKQVACGEAHSLAVTVDGNVFGWGLSNYGQLGLGLKADNFEPGTGNERCKIQEPTRVDRLGNFNIERVSSGYTFSLFITNEGELFSCGMNDLGQLGVNVADSVGHYAQKKPNRRNPVRAQNADLEYPTRVDCFRDITITDVACGENHAIAIADFGEGRRNAYAWGMYKHGQLGLGEVNKITNPRILQMLHSGYIKSIAAGAQHSMALLGDPSVYANRSVSLTDDKLNFIWNHSYEFGTHSQLDIEHIINEEGNVGNPR